MKSLMPFLQTVLQDLGDWCYTSTSRDFKTISARFEHEGDSFLTISLANFGKDFEKSLDQGFVDSSQFLGFSRTGGLPRLFSGFLCRVFDRSSGRLLDDPDIECIRAVRQISLMFSKILLPCSEKRVSDAFDAFIKCEKDVREWDSRSKDRDWSSYDRISTLLWADVFSNVDQRVYEGSIIPKHGPGATADRLTSNRKWDQVEWTGRLDSVFPLGDFLLPNARHYKCLDQVSILEPGAERPVRVVAVPKTLKTPRIIAIEPTCMQYVQQGLLAAIGNRIEELDIPRRLVGWRSNVPNQHLASLGSRNGALATLDLREASDRVSNQLVRRLLRNHPFLAEGVDACRSRKADVPGSSRLRLAKFASMGSALTFPFEAMVFCTVVFIGIEKELNRPITQKDIKSFLGSVRVYGDDIIIPVDFVESVIASLEDFGFLVNASKSFWTGKFRESCGKEYYDGHDVSIVRVRRLFPTHRTDGAEIISVISLRNQLYKAGLWRATAWLDDYIRKHRWIRHFPIVEETSPIQGRHSFLPYRAERVHDTLHSPLVKGITKVDRSPDSPLDDLGALLKVLVTNADQPTLLSGIFRRREDDWSDWDVEDMPILSADHLHRSGRPRSVSTKTRWATPY